MKGETIPSTTTQTSVKEHLLVRRGMDVNEHERLFNITLRQSNGTTCSKKGYGCK